MLLPGAPEFVYQSCTRQAPGKEGVMEGEFKFVEGTIERPSGGEFDVMCPRFKLARPEYLF